MQARELYEANEDDLDLAVFVDFEPAAICGLADCGEFSRDQFSTLMRLCSNDVVRSVFEGLKDSTLHAFLMSPGDLQPFLETAIPVLGEEGLRRRAKQWLVAASKARTKDETIKCSNIIQAIILHQSKRSNAGQQVLEPLPNPRLRPTQISPSANLQEHVVSPTAQPNTTLPSASVHPLPVGIASAQTGNPSHISPPSPERESSSALFPSPPRGPQAFPLDAPQATEPHLPRSPKRLNPPSPSSPIRPPHDTRLLTSLSAGSPAFNVLLPSHIGRNQDTTEDANLLRAKADLTEQNPATSSDVPIEETTLPSLPLFPLPTQDTSNRRTPPPAQDTSNQGTPPPIAPHNVGDQQGEHDTIASPSKRPPEMGLSEDLDEAAQQDRSPEETTNKVAARVSSVNPWDAATNAEQVAKWGLEDVIHGDPHHTSPFRTEWMYDDRKKATGKNDVEYEALTDQEYSKFAEIPPAVRDHAGKVFNKKSKFDWEIRVVLGRLAYDYSQMDEPENRKFLHDALPEVEARFPDIDPAHTFRQIDQEGPKAVQKWRSDVAKWVQTTAGKMSGTHNDLEHHVEILDTKKSSKKFDAHQLLGLKRAEVNYVLWGKTAEGKKKCNPIINAEMKVWAADPKNQQAMALDSKVFGQHRVNVEGRVRREKFELLPQAEQNEWTRKAKAKFGDSDLTEEELHAAAECLLPHINQVVGQSAEVADLHIILLASGTISGGRIPVIMKEFGAKSSQGPFLNSHDVGGRAKAEYPNYVSVRFQADPSELMVLDQGADDVLHVSAEQPLSSKPKNTSKSKGKGKSTQAELKQLPAQGGTSSSHPESRLVLNHWKPSASVNTNVKRADYMARFFTKTFKLNFPSKISWNKVSSENDRYIDPQRRPQTLNGQPIQLMNPLGMPVETHLNPWWDFMQNCAQGRVSAEKIFCWKPETTRLAIPPVALPADPDVHMAGELSRTANPQKRPRAGPTSRRKTAKSRSSARPLSEEPEMELETDMESGEEDQGDLEDQATSSRVLRTRPMPRIPANTSPGFSNNGDDGESGTSGSEFEPVEGQSRVAGSVSMSRPRARGLGEHGASSSRPDTSRVPSLEAEDVENSALENDLGPRSPSPANNAPPPKSPPLATTEAAPKSASPPLPKVPHSSPPLLTFPAQTSSDPVRSTSQQATINSSPANPVSNTSGSGTIVSDMSSNASAAIASTSAGLPPKALNRSIAPANATPSSSGNLASASTLGDAPTNISGEAVAPANTVLSPTLPLPFTELHLVHPRMFSREATASGSPAWLQVKPLWEIWGTKVAFLNVEQCELSLSPTSPKPDIALPSALTSAISITQIYLALQRSDPHRPDTPLVQVSPTCCLGDLHPHHHLRQIVEGILDVKTPLPSSKAFESNMLLSIEAVDAFFGALEGSLESFIDELTSSEQTLRYAEVEFFTSLRLALYVKGTTLMRDEGASGPSIERANSLIDRLVSVFAGIAALRYMQEYLGDALARWTREDSDNSGARWEMWYSFWQFWKAGMSGLASALSQGRKDLFQYRALNAIISPSVKTIIDHLMASPAWWSPPGDGVPLPFRVGLKQFIPSEALFAQLPHIQWSRLSFLDRTSILLLLFICAIQLSQEPSSSTRLKYSDAEDSASLVSLFITSCRSLKEVIEGSFGTEEGPKYNPAISDDKVQRRRMVEAWMKVWQSERGPEDPTGPQGTSIIPPWAKDTVRVPPETPEPMDLDEPQEVPTEQERNPLPEATGDPASIPGDRVPPADEEEGDLGAVITSGAGKKRKRKVPVGGRRIAEPTVGLAENPRQHLKEVATKALEKDPEDRPRRQAYLNSPYVSAPQAPTSPLKAPSKKPKAAAAKAKAVAKSSAPSSSARKLTKRQTRAEAARKEAEAKVVKSAAGR